VSTHAVCDIPWGLFASERTSERNRERIMASDGPTERERVFVDGRRAPRPRPWYCYKHGPVRCILHASLHAVCVCVCVYVCTRVCTVNICIQGVRKLANVCIAFFLVKQWNSSFIKIYQFYKF